MMRRRPLGGAELVMDAPDGDERELTDVQYRAPTTFNCRARRVQQPAAEDKQPGQPIRAVIELLATVGVAVGLALLIQAVLVKPYKIPSGSMIPTLAIGQRILVDRLATHPGLGDVVVFHPPTGAEVGDEGVCGNARQGFGLRQACDKDSGHESSETYVKRVVGLPGDHLRSSAGRSSETAWRNEAPTSSPAIPARATATSR